METYKDGDNVVLVDTNFFPHVKHEGQVINAHHTRGVLVLANGKKFAMRPDGSIERKITAMRGFNFLPHGEDAWKVESGLIVRLAQ